MLSDSIVDIMNIFYTNGYSKEETDFILQRNGLYNIKNFYIKNKSLIAFSKDNNLFCDTLIEFNNNIIDINYIYVSLRTSIKKNTSYYKNNYNFFDEIIQNETIIKKDFDNYQNFLHTTSKTNFLNKEIILSYYIVESSYNDKLINKLINKNLELNTDSFNKINIKPNRHYIYNATRNKDSLNRVTWKYIDNNSCLTGENICSYDNNLQYLMNNIDDNINNYSLKKNL